MRRNLIANYGGQGWSALINLALIPVYVSYLGVESYGLVGILTIVMTCMTALDAGMTPTLNREMARFSAGEHSAQSINDLLRSIEFLILGVVGCAIVVGVLASGWLAAHWLGSSTLSHQAVSRAIGLIVCVAGLRIVEGVYRSALLGAQRHVWLNAVSAGFATLRACGAVAVLHWVGPSIENFFVWQAIASLLAVAVLARATRRLLPRPDHRPRFRIDTLVGVLDADQGLFSADFRASERLFSNLMQVAGRAGRGGARSSQAEVLVQTRAPEHPLFDALVRHDFSRFAASLLDERRRAGLPPFSYQAVLRAEARAAEDALTFLNAARGEGIRVGDESGSSSRVTLYDPVPMTIARIAGIERAQLLVESSARPAMHAFLDAWLAALHGMRARTRWHVEVDPLDI